MSEDSENFKNEYGTFEELVSDMEKRSKSKNPKVAKEAKEILRKIDYKMQKEIDAMVEAEYEREKKEREKP
jgi:hypothetical protein